MARKAAMTNSSELVHSLRLWADDPMWAHHAEVPKVVLAMAADTIERLSAENAQALGYATRFLESYVHKYCDPNPEWKPLPELIGVLTQIDNASTVTGEILNRAEKAEAQLAERASARAGNLGYPE